MHILVTLNFEYPLGVHAKNKIFKENMNLNWNFEMGGRGFKQQNASSKEFDSAVCNASVCNSSQG